MTGPLAPHLSAAMAAAAAAVAAGDDGAAESLLRRILAEDPGAADAWHLLAVVAVRTGRAGEAIELARRAFELERRNADYLNTLGVAYGEAGQFEQSLQCFKRALKARPNHADGHYNLGKVYRKLGRLPEAEQCYLRARRLDPARTDVANNLALLYSRQARWADALDLFVQARAKRPQDEAVAINTAIARLASSGPDAAIAELASFAQHHPSAASVRAELGRRLLAQGRFAEGWREYAWRHGRAPADLQDCAGKRVLLVPEQGIGDHLFFLRFAPALRARAAHVAFACPDKLFALLEHCPALDELRRGVPREGFDVVLPVGDVPRLLDARDTPAPLPIAVAPERIQHWRKRLAACGPPPYLGVTWRAGTQRDDLSEFAAADEDRLYKEIEIAVLAPALRAWRGSVLILQRRPRVGETAHFCRALGRPAEDLSTANDELAEMAAVLSLLDEYVGVSNTNTHLRAGLGKGARVLVPFPPEFRWMHAGQGSPWFPGARVYREAPTRDWKLALESLGNDISN